MTLMSAAPNVTQENEPQRTPSFTPLSSNQPSSHLGGDDYVGRMLWSIQSRNNEKEGKAQKRISEAYF